jgi:hypothetical protein
MNLGVLIFLHSDDMYPLDWPIKALATVYYIHM